MSFWAELDYYVVLGALGIALAAIVASTLGQKAGLAVAAADAVGVAIYGLSRDASALMALSLWTGLWTALMLGVGFGFEPLARRFGFSLFRLDRNVLFGAAIGLIVAIFTAGLGMLFAGAFLGALAGGLFSGAHLKRAFFDALGALLGLFGGDGVRLMATISVVYLVVQGSGALR